RPRRSRSRRQGPAARRRAPDRRGLARPDHSRQRRDHADRRPADRAVHSRKEEYEADRHGAEILQRAGYSKDVMINTLTWLMQTEGASGGGFFATHPATGDRIEALKKS